MTHSILLATSAAAAIATQASANLLYSQPLDTSFMGGAGSNARNFERFAEGFVLSSSSSIDQVRWWGMRTGSLTGGPLTGFQTRFCLSDGPNFTRRRTRQK